MKRSDEAPAITIFALSSGRPPAAVAVIRISGNQSGPVLDLLMRGRPEPRRATLGALRDPGSGEILDRGLVLWFPGPRTATGEDVAELHLHGGRAVVDAVLAVLATLPRLRAAEPGEFTRRAFENGILDLNQAEGLADLLSAETQSQRRAAVLAAGGALSRRVAEWQSRLVAISAAIEAAIDYSDEDDVGSSTHDFAMRDAAQLGVEMKALLAAPRAERLKDGVRVVVSGPPNSGKSSLVNALAGRDAAIESSVPGTTRDTIEVPLALGGVPILLVDTAGLRQTSDEIEAEGVARASRAAAGADIVLWLGDEDAPDGPSTISLHPRADLRPPHPSRLSVSARTGYNVDVLAGAIIALAKSLLPPEGEIALNQRQYRLIQDLAEAVARMTATDDPLIAAEEGRHARAFCDCLTGQAGVEEMLDSLFSRFCVGK